MRTAVKITIAVGIVIGIVFSAGPLLAAWLYVTGSFFGYERTTASAIEKANPNICFKMMMEVNEERCGAWPCGRVDLCLMEVGIAHKNPTACELIGSRGYYDNAAERCYAEALSDAEPTVQAEACQTLLGGHHQEKCFGLMAAGHGDAAFCSRAPNQKTRDGCVYQFVRAQPTVNHAVCHEITGVAEKEICLSIAAVQKNDSSICSELTDDPEGKSNCLEKVLRKQAQAE